MDKLFTVKVTGLKDVWPIKFISQDFDVQYQKDWLNDGLSVEQCTDQELKEYLDQTKDDELFGIEIYGSKHLWEVETRIPGKTVNKMMYDGLRVARIILQVDLKSKSPGCRMVK